MNVAVGIILDGQNRVLLTKRPGHVDHGGQWEFPGGKLEAGETGESALCRELEEELGIQVTAHRYLGCVQHAYHQYDVTLLAYAVEAFTGQPSCLAGQTDLKWVELDELGHYPLPDANTKLIALLDLDRA